MYEEPKTIQEVLETSAFKITKFQKIYFDSNPNEIFPLCGCGCRELVLLNYTDKGTIFRQYASATCSRASKTIPKEAQDLLSNKEWLYDQRFIQRKAKELIASELNISVVPITKWLRRHGIDNLRLNESEFNIQEILTNKEKLEDDYATGKTIQELANDYGTSKATLSLFFKKHGIVTREPNSYERINKKTSKEENDLRDWILSVYSGELRQGVRSIITPKEIDLYLPTINLGIEYNGIYSHIYRPHETTDSKIKGPEYHLNKTNGCSDKGVKLIHIYSDQWLSRKTAVKTILMSNLGVNERIFARKCTIGYPAVHEKNQFLNEYHLQGADKSQLRYGLYHEGKLVALMTFRTSRYNKDYKWELVRYCGCLGLTVVGGFSKLLKAFMREHEGSIISYADRNYSDGGVYVSNGFTLAEVNPPNFHYVNFKKGIRVHRSTYTKKRLLKLMGIEHTDKSEKEIIDDLKIKKIFNCGTLRYVIER